MAARDWEGWMWAQARDLFAEAGRIERRIHETAAVARSLAGEGSFAPPVDVVEAGGLLVVTAALAGVAREDVEVRIDDDELVVAGRRGRRVRGAGATPRVLEIPCGRFERRVPLPAAAYAIASAELDQGLLTVTLARRP